MKNNVLLSVFGALVIVSRGFAQAPTLTITAPTGTLVVSSFPFNTNINMQITHPAGLEHLQVFDTEVSQISPVSTAYSLLTHIGNPFDQNGACSGQMTPVNKISACSTTLGVGNVSVMWQVPAAGTYSMKVTLKYQGNLGVDIEPVTFTLLLSVEYPAPPAIANAFINSAPSLKKAGPTVRGCVVSQIAALQSQTQKYNPHPGPYNVPLVQSDVTALWPGCSQ